MIYIELFLVATLFFVLGMYYGVRYSIQVLNKEALEKMAVEALNKAMQTASSIRNLCEDYVYAAIKTNYNFPYNSADVKAYIQRKINLN